MSTSTASRPAFREPWSFGAKAYFEADTFEAAKAGFKRKRKDVIFHMPNDGEAGRKACLFCGGKLNAPARAVTREMGNNTRVESPAGTKVDTYSTWTYLAKQKGVGGGMHYVCSWSNLLGRITAIRY